MTGVQTCALPIYREFENNGIIYLLHSLDLDTGEGHYNLVTHPKKLFSVKFYCEECNVGYKEFKSHKCSDIPEHEWCKSCYDRCCGVSLGEWGRCPSCDCILRCVACADRHQLAKCVSKYACSFCNAVVRRLPVKCFDENGSPYNRLLTDGEMMRYHQCNMHWCRECEKLVEDDHLCYVRHVKVKAQNNKLMFF